MAYWQYKKVKNNRYVFVYTRIGGKPKALPREMTKHLDAQPQHNIDQWVAQYEQQYEHSQVQPNHIHFSNSKLEEYVQAYLKYMQSRNKSEVTIKQHESMLRRFAIPFFLGQPQPLTDPQQWNGISIQLLPWLKNQLITDSVIFRVNVALRGFYKFLYDESIVNTSSVIKLRNPVMPKKDTPLQFTVTPEEVIRFVKLTEETDIKLLALIGFFFSLRPQETFALTPKEFAAGSRVESLECSKAMSKSKLFSRLAVNITKQQGKSRGKHTTPKAGSKGWVCCFDKKAAEILVGLLNTLPADEQLFRVNNRELYKRWHKLGIEGITLKDLRRASLYWLGHNTSLQPIELSKHARHSNFETSMLYLRRPEEELESNWSRLNLAL